MTEGNSMTDGQPLHEISTGGDIMKSLAPGAFGVTITTTDVKAGFNNIETVALQSADGGTLFAEHHQLGTLTMGSNPIQDIPPGETQTRP
jgi:hypothetical protein